MVPALASELLADAKSAKFPAALSVGVFMAVRRIFSGIYLAAIIFSGALAPFAARGAGALLFGGCALCLITALTSTYKGALSAPMSAPAAILFTIGVSVTASLSDASGEAMFVTMIVIMGLSTVVTAVCFMLIGEFRLANLFRFMPYPVVSGFLAGLGWFMVAGSFSVMCGISPNWETLPRFLEFDMVWRWVPGVLYAFGLFFIMRRWSHFLILPVSAVLAIGLCHAVLFALGISVEQAGDAGILLTGIPTGSLWPPIGPGDLIQVDWGVVALQVPDLLGIALLMLMYLVMNVSAVELGANMEMDLNREFRAGAVGCLIAGLGGSSPGCIGASRSLMSHEAGANTRLTGVVTALVLGSVLFVGGDVLEMFPRLLIGGLVLFVGIRLLNKWLVATRKEMPLSDYGIVLSIAVAIGLLGFLEGLAVGLVVTVIFFVVRFSRVDVVAASFTGRDRASKRIRPAIHRAILREQGEGERVRVHLLGGYIFFGSASSLGDRLKQTLRADPPPRCLLLDFTGVSGLDISAVNVFSRVIRAARQVQSQVVLSTLPERVRLTLRHGLPDRDWRNLLLEEDLDHGLERCEEIVIAEWTRLHGTSEDTRKALLDVSIDDAVRQLERQARFEELTERLRPWLQFRDYAAGETIVARGERQEGHLEERYPVFAERELEALALGHSPGRYSIGEIRDAVAWMVRDGHLVEARQRDPDRSFVTDRTLKAERSVIAAMKAGLGEGEALADGEEVAAHLAGAGLTAGQEEAVRTVLLSGDRIVGVQGRAGTGKTTMLRHIRELAGDRRVVGLAPSAAVARVLGRETGIHARTLQWFLTRCQSAGRDGRAGDQVKELFGGSVVVLDESSMVSTDQMGSLMRIADRLGVARLVLVGDTGQLRAVDAGQPFLQLQRAGMTTAEMNDILRQRNPELRAAVLASLSGEPGKAVELLRSSVHEVPYEELGEAAARSWLALAPETRDRTLLLAPTHALRAEINGAVRAALADEGVLRGKTLTIQRLVSLGMTRAEKGDVRNYREGDTVVFHQNLANYRVRKDEALTVSGIGGDLVTLNHPDGGPRHIRPAGSIRYRLDVYETRPIEIRAGDRIRWTRNDHARGLINGERAEVVAIARGRVRLRLEEGREVSLADDAPQGQHGHRDRRRHDGDGEEGRPHRPVFRRRRFPPADRGGAARGGSRQRGLDAAHLPSEGGRRAAPPDRRLHRASGSRATDRARAPPDGGSHIDAGTGVRECRLTSRPEGRHCRGRPPTTLVPGNSSNSILPTRSNSSTRSYNVRCSFSDSTSRGSSPPGPPASSCSAQATRKPETGMPSAAARSLISALSTRLQRSVRRTTPVIVQGFGAGPPSGSALADTARQRPSAPGSVRRSSSASRTSHASTASPRALQRSSSAMSAMRCSSSLERSRSSRTARRRTTAGNGSGWVARCTMYREMSMPAPAASSRIRAHSFAVACTAC